MRKDNELGYNVQSSVLHYLELDLLPYCSIGWHLRPVGWGLSGAVTAGFQSLWPPGCVRSAGWLELRWHLMIWEQGRGFDRPEADARWRKEQMQSRTVNRWKVPRRSW